VHQRSADWPMRGDESDNIERAKHLAEDVVPLIVAFSSSSFEVDNRVVNSNRALSLPARPQTNRLFETRSARRQRRV